ncbi:hypothetical protein R1sor_019810 [Riccia sorocarpa]|uniref:3-dehydroquinate synthase n=1 Tax=Riccia sorocarpa TaxID=122646 RepID=A0ABD3IDK2_9MARC
MMPLGLMPHKFSCKSGANMAMLLPGEGRKIRPVQALDSGGRASVKLEKKVWVWTQNKDVMTASVERGWNTFIFTSETESLATAWQALSTIRPLILRDKVFRDPEGNAIALLGQVTSGLGQEDVKALVGQSETVVMSALDWQIITAENMVAAFQDTSTTLFATAANAKEARLYFEALEKGTDGVVLQTEDPAEVFSLKAYLASRSEEENRISLRVATVVKVEATGMGDRVCVDLCNIMNPGEGLLVGSFARGLFLVHSECLTTDYVASRPFRVNAGPVHAYVAVPGGRTSYLCELRSGTEVVAVNAEGKTRPVTVGRVKIESRPLMLVEVEFEGTTYSLFLQNAETVCLVSPSTSDGQNGQGRGEAAALPVTRLKAGDKVLIGLQGGARHTGLQIDEFILEK